MALAGYNNRWVAYSSNSWKNLVGQVRILRPGKTGAEEECFLF